MHAWLPNLSKSSHRYRTCSMKSHFELPFPRLISGIMVELLEFLHHLLVILLQDRKSLLDPPETQLLIRFLMVPGRILHTAKVLDLLASIFNLDQTYSSG